MEAGHQGNGAAAARAMGAEARLAGWFFENAPDLFAVISSQGRFLAANPAWSAATGYLQKLKFPESLISFKM